MSVFLLEPATVAPERALPSSLHPPPPCLWNTLSNSVVRSMLKGDTEIRIQKQIVIIFLMNDKMTNNSTSTSSFLCLCNAAFKDAHSSGGYSDPLLCIQILA